MKHLVVGSWIKSASKKCSISGLKPNNYLVCSSEQKSLSNSSFVLNKLVYKLLRLRPTRIPRSYERYKIHL